MRDNYTIHLICSQVWLAGSMGTSGWTAFAMLALGVVWLLTALLMLRYPCNDIVEEPDGV